MRPLTLGLALVLGTSLFVGCTSEGDDDDDAMTPPPSSTDDPPSQPPPPPPPSQGTKDFGEACQTSSECASDLCLEGACSEYCSIDVANDCQPVGGLCVALATGNYGCYGDLDTGYDEDDAVLRIGDSATRSLSPLHDVDVFLIHVDEGQTFATATPSGSVDLQLEAFDPMAQPFFVGNEGGGGTMEGIAVTAEEDSYLYLVVRNIGTSTGSYSIRVFE